MRVLRTAAKRHMGGVWYYCHELGIGQGIGSSWADLMSTSGAFLGPVLRTSCGMQKMKALEDMAEKRAVDTKRSRNMLASKTPTPRTLYKGP